MGTQNVTELTPRERASFLRDLVQDLEALELMLERSGFDEDIRVGAEQEYVLVDEHLSPAPLIEELLSALRDPRFTVELGRFNLEANLTPRPFRGRCLSALRQELVELTGKARAAARRFGAGLLMTGILPTYDPIHARLENMTVSARFREFNRASLACHGGLLPVSIQGRDAFTLWNDNIMLEAAPTSFQLHLQVTPATFASAFNSALVLAAPLVAVSANAPLLAGHRLWHETRIPLLERSADIRSPASAKRGGRSRTSLGDGFVESSVLEIFRRDLARFDCMFSAPPREPPLQTLRNGGAPALSALTSFNGTVWRWVRPCYGVTNGKPHLRIENRVLSAGPTILDEVANAAFWLGLMVALPERYPEPQRLIGWDDVDANFHAAARAGLDAELLWLNGERVNAAELVLEELLPLARSGLQRVGVDDGEAAEALVLIAQRARTGLTGAQWMLNAFEALPEDLSRRERAFRVTSALMANADGGEPVSRWPSELGACHHSPPAWVALRTELHVLPPEAPAQLAAFVLRDEPDGCVVVEDETGQFVRLVTLQELAGATGMSLSELPAHEVPELDARLSVDEALRTLGRAGAACGVVLRDGVIVGVLSADELLRLAQTCPAPASREEREPREQLR